MSDNIENEDIIDSDNNTDSSDELKTDIIYTKYTPQYSEKPNNLPGMFYKWYLEYASYVVLYRSIPHISDGFKPVQRRVLYSMRKLEDGRYNKVANIVGHTMQFHPHGDSSIYETLVKIGQKNLLIDTQGNWGNILTGDDAAAARYIEARLSKFAIDTVFNAKTTEWKPTYDGRNEEPIYLPVKFPLLLYMGTQGVGVGLKSTILPHNFNELLDASILYLIGKDFELYPDFPTGGMMDASKYKDGTQGGRIKVRAKISKTADNKSLIINDIPYGITTEKLIDSIVAANNNGKINIRKVDDNTAENVEIVVHLEPRTSSDKTIDALYAFTKCEESYSTNCCVIDGEKPIFTSVSNVLRKSTDRTVDLLKWELEIERVELIEQLLAISLEQLFIDKRIYKDKEFEDAKSIDLAIKHIDKSIEPYKKDFVRDVTRDDIAKLLEIRMARILKFNTDKTNEQILNLKNKIDEVDEKLNNLIEYAIGWFEYLKKTYGKDYPRCTEIRSFETIDVTEVVETNEKLYVNKAEGFIGINIKKEEGFEFVQNCSDIDDVIIFFKDGKYKIVKVSEKQFVGNDIEHIAVYKKNDERTIYNAIYRDGKNGSYYMKRFFVSGVIRDKEYDLTNGKPNSKLIYFSANPNGEAEIVKIYLRPTSRRIRKMQWEIDFSQLAIKGRGAKGNIVTKFPVSKITFKHSVGSTLGGTEIWFDKDVFKINQDKRGEFLGEFFNDDLILVICKNGDFYTTNFDITNYYSEDIMIIEKFDADKIWSVVLFDADKGYDYIKRFKFEESTERVSFIGENKKSKLKIITEEESPVVEVVFGGKDKNKDPLIIDIKEFIKDKSYKAKGKRISTYDISSIKKLKSVEKPKSDENNTINNVEDSNNQDKVSKKDYDAPAKTTLIYDKDKKIDTTQGNLFDL